MFIARSYGIKKAIGEENCVIIVLTIPGFRYLKKIEGCGRFFSKLKFSCFPDLSVNLDIEYIKLYF